MNSQRHRQSRSLRVESLESRILLTAPVLDPITSKSVPSGQSLIVPLTATDTDGNPLTYSVASSSTTIGATILHAGPDIKLSVAGYGDITLQLLPEVAPTAVSRIVSLVNSGFYNGLTFHRVVPNFVIQGGDPNGNGTGGATGTGFPFADEFDPNTIFSGDGQLALANSGPDTNSSQFFITVGAQRFLDFGYSLFGQVLRGMSVVRAIDAAPNSGSPNNTPDSKIVITSASVVPDTTDSVLVLDAAAEGSSSVTVTVDDGHGGQDAKTFSATTADDALPVARIPAASTATNTPITIPLPATSLDGKTLSYTVTSTDNPAHETSQVVGNNLTVTPEAGYSGTLTLEVVANQSGQSSPTNKQILKVNIGNQVLNVQGFSFSGAVEGLLNSIPVATFTATVPYAASAFSVAVHWSDGTTTNGTITQGADGTYTATTSKSFDRAGTYTASVTVTDSQSGRSGSATLSDTVSDAPLSATFALNGGPTASASFAGTLAVFADTNARSNPADLSASIDWGDGSTTPGTISRFTDGSYAVNGTRIYAGPGSFPVRVTINDIGGATATAEGTLTIANHPPVLDAIGPRTIDEGSTLFIQASAHDPDAGQHVTYSLAPGSAPGATIDPISGVISYTPTAGPLSTTITVVATDNGSPAMTASTSFGVMVNDVPPTLVLASTASARQFSPFGAAGRFADPGLSTWTATVDYGDGTGVQPLSLSSDHSFNLSHTYTSSGTFRAEVRVTDAGGQTGSADVNVAVVPVPTVHVAKATARLNKKKQVVGIDLGLDGQVDATAAGNSSAFVILAPGRDKKFGTRDDVATLIASATYNPSSGTISLTLKKPLVPRGPLQLRVSGLRDVYARPVVIGSGGSIVVSLGKSALTVLSTVPR
jgi:cyclophilin family peptidyl-prolyl cis-trans isomerase